MSSWHIKSGTDSWDIIDDQGRLIGWIVSHGHFDMKQAEEHAGQICMLHNSNDILKKGDITHIVPKDSIKVMTSAGVYVWVKRKVLTKAFNEMIRAKIDPRKKK